jgi:hypothetical protein
MTAPTRHLVTVWNPSYAADAMDAHLDVLLDWARRHAEGKAEREEVYVWWAKLRSENRLQPMPHTADILALDEQIQRPAPTHLYLTDYRSLYVAQLGEITAEDIRENEGESEHCPAYYLEPGRHADLWFSLFDIRRLVADDTVAVVAELKRLRNARYHDRPVSLYGGMTELPLIVWCDEEPDWFSDRASLIEETLWAERDGRLRGDVERLGADLRDNLVGRALWPQLSLGTRNFLATGEAVFRRHRDDPHFDFSAAAIEYAKALEVELNRVLHGGLRDAGGKQRYSLGELADLLRDPPQSLRTWLTRTFPRDASFFLSELPLRLGAIRDLRNPAAHRERVSLARTAALRDEILGIGQDGLVAWLARLEPRKG